jgi:CheY-like chemotaxis protein
MATPRKILIADPDVEGVRALSRALRQKGYQVHYAVDGSKALELAVLRHPDLALFDDACRLLDPRTFTSILRSNPRTADIPVLLTGRSFDAERLRGWRDGFLKKPYNQDELLARVDQIFRRAEAASQLRGQREIEGTLSQLSIADLMQILALNRRTGKLSLVRGTDRGEIHVADGKPVNARAGAVEGEKALFRLLSWTEGSFELHASAPAGKPRINRSMDEALLEAMRHGDEVGRLLPSLPPRNVWLHVPPDVERPPDPHPVTAQVLEALAQPRTMAELLDLAPATDLELLSALSALMQKGVVRVAEETGQGQGGPLLGPAEVHALRTRIFRGRPSARAAVAKVFVCGHGPPALKKMLQGLRGAAKVAPEPPALKSGFGTFARYEVSDALSVEFCSLPPLDAARPLWRPFTAGTVGGLLLDTSERAVGLGRYLAFEVRAPVVVMGAEVPAALHGAPAGAAAVGQDPAEALRALLVQSLNPVQPPVGPPGGPR